MIPKVLPVKMDGVTMAAGAVVICSSGDGGSAGCGGCDSGP